MRRAIFGAALLVVACTPGERQAAKTAIEIAKAICIIDKQALPDSEVAVVCGIAEPLLDPMEQLLMTARATTRAMTMAASAACGKDGGR